MSKKILFSVAILFLWVVSFAQNHAVVNHEVTVANTLVAENKEKLTPEEAEKEKLKEENQEYILHHLKDAHSFDIMKTKEGHHVGFPLPVIFYDQANGFKAFMSSEFHHNENGVVEKDGQFYRLYHNEKIYKTDKEGSIILDKNGFPSNEKVIDLSITKGVLSIIVVSILMLIFFGGMARNYKNSQVPTGFGRFLEPLVLFVRDDIAKPNIGPKYKKFTGYLLTAFFFILFLNIFGLLPFGINVTGNITITFFFALMTYLITQISANWDYWKHIFWMPGIPVPMKLIMLPIELLGTLTKPFALMIRLFANMSAGHIVVMSLIALIYVFKNIVAGVAFPFLTLVIYLLEVLVAFLQAYIFTMLSALFIGMAVQDHHHEEEHTH